MFLTSFFSMLSWLALSPAPVFTATAETRARRNIYEAVSLDRIKICGQSWIWVGCAKTNPPSGRCRGIYRLTIMIGRCENLYITGLIFGGRLNREVSHGGHCSTSGNHSHRGSYFLPCTTERLQTTEVKKSLGGLACLSCLADQSVALASPSDRSSYRLRMIPK